jgi:hypothetical protein
MRIDGPRAYAPAHQTQRPAAAGGPAFQPVMPQTPGAAETRAPAHAAATAGLDALIALQMVEGPLDKRKRGLKRGRAMLDALDDLKISLLSGRMPADQLRRLVIAVDGRERDSEDERLEAILDEIELRARVELAKLEPARRAHM